MKEKERKRGKAWDDKIKVERKRRKIEGGVSKFDLEDESA